MNQFQKDIADKKEALKEAHTVLVKESEKHQKDTLLFLYLNSQAAGVWNQICLLDQVEALYGQHHSGARELTVEWWLNTLDEPFKSQALKNCVPSKLKCHINTLDGALNFAFAWDSSPEGHDYWSKLWSATLTGSAADIHPQEIRTEGKTILEWFGTLGEPYRTQALANCKHPHYIVCTLREAVMLGVDWFGSPEGAVYWSNLCLTLKEK